MTATPPSPAGPLRRLLGVLLKLGLSVVILLAGLEVGTRLLAPVDRFEFIPNTFDPVCGIVQVPGAVGFIDCPEYRITMRISEQGLRDHLFALPAPRGTRRILVLGDSFAHGFGVSREATFAKVLERSLQADGRPVEVVNAGVAGTGTTHQLAWLDDRGWRFAPDLVVLAHVVNDFTDNTKSGLFTLAPDSTLRQHRATQSRTLALLRHLRQVPGYTTWFARSHFLNAFRQWFARRHHDQLATTAAGGDAPAAVLDHEMALQRALLRRLRAVCEDHGAALAVMPVPALPGSGAAEQQQQELFAFLFREGFATVDLREDAAGRRAAGEVLYYPVDGHWTAAGHRMAAAALQALWEGGG